MCCLRYEHEFYVQQRKRFPKEGKLVPTAKGQEKVIVNDIFRERITLRSDDGETRVLSLEELRQEMGGERIAEPTGEEEAFVSPVEGVPEEVILLQDTVELPAWVPRSPDSPRPPSTRQLPVTQAPPAPAPIPDAADDVGDEVTGDDDAEDVDSAAAPDVAGSSARPERRRRRRGRRGGRRNRGPERRPGADDAPQPSADEPGGDNRTDRDENAPGGGSGS
jgi:hypothetical protein